MGKRFALIGSAGYVAPRHMEAIHAIGGELVAAVDPHDSVGILDRYTKEVKYFREIERFDRFLNTEGSRIDYVVICSPNYLHDSHVRMALRAGADAICEKPLAINPWNCDALEKLEQETGKHVFTILQLRHHEGLLTLKNYLKNNCPPRFGSLQYYTPRGPWYHYSWKGDSKKSGGLVNNIGIHLFDALLWLFGEVKLIKIMHTSEKCVTGTFLFETTDIDWRLSIDPEINDGKPKRVLSFKDDPAPDVDLSYSFNDLHQQVYEDIMKGEGVPISEARRSVELVHQVRLVQSSPHKS